MPKHFINLQLFAEDAVGSDGSGDLASPVAEGTESTEPVAPEEGNNEPTWDELISGKYKKEYGKSVREAVNQRFKNQRDLQAQIDNIDPMIKALAQKYGVEADMNGRINIEDLKAKVMDDNELYEQEAFKRGMSVKDLKELKALERENAQLKRMNAQTEEQREWDAIVEQGNALKGMYPDFDLDEEMQNPNFGRLLATLQKSGFGNAVQNAYELVHKDEIMGGAMQYAVQKTEQKISNSIQSNMRRPAENGTTQRSVAQVGAMDPSKLTKSQIEDLKRRAERGERITFS